LRWGSYRLRYVLGIVLALGGGLLVQLTSAYSLVALPTGLFVHVVGWCILPGIGWRRVVGATVGTFLSMLMLNGASSVVFLAAGLAAWLFLRERPLVSYSVLVLPALAAFVLMQSFADYGWSGLVLSVAVAVLVGAAWLGWLLAAISRPRRPATR
jgi:hypothetical protein